jgi:hypothetical protein
VARLDADSTRIRRRLDATMKGSRRRQVVEMVSALLPIGTS